MVHEFGHFWTARHFGVRVDVFSLGFGPRLFGFKKGETDFRLSLSLLGGYVKLARETDAEHPRGLLGKPRWQRLIISFAGPSMNAALAVALPTGLYMVEYRKDHAVIATVTPETPAAKLGFSRATISWRSTERRIPPGGRHLAGGGQDAAASDHRARWQIFRHDGYAGVGRAHRAGRGGLD
ncbi:MAG TPA: site-2 protease family protein [Bryobacteraceae bacterium]|nr:site-2 protease family protein [Bryobacteraceae bacterium]